MSDRHDNEVLLIGRLTRDPEVKQLASGKQLTKLALAYNHTKEKVSFFNVTFWGGCDTLRKGDKVKVIGYLQQDTWTGKDGQKRYAINIISNHIEPLSDGPRQEKPQDNFSDAVNNVFVKQPVIEEDIP